PKTVWSYPLTSLAVLENPQRCGPGNLGDQEQVVPAEIIRLLPLGAGIPLEQPPERDVVANPVLRSVRPDGGLDLADPHFVKGLILGRRNLIGSSLLRHKAPKPFCPLLHRRP